MPFFKPSIESLLAEADTEERRIDEFLELVRTGRVPSREHDLLDAMDASSRLARIYQQVQKCGTLPSDWTDRIRRGKEKSYALERLAE